MNIEPGFSRKSAPTTMPAEEEHEAARKRRLRIIIASVAALVVIVAFLVLRGGGTPAPVVEAAPRVTVITPTRQSVAREVSVTGTLAARREMPVGIAGEGGMIERVVVEPGDWVRAGQVLATIDAAVQAQQANQLRAQITAARADAALAESELKRSQALVGRGFVSQADVDRKTATRDGARARVALAQAQLGETNARIGRLAIRAPAAGLVMTREVEPGQVVGSGNTALFRLAKGGEMELLANLSESDVANLSVGDTVAVTPVGSTETFEGKVWQVSPVIDSKTRQGQARVALAYNKALRPGGFASGRISSGSAMVPLLPESAVMNDEQGSYVYIVGADNKVARRAVKVGPVNDTGLPILSGLTGTEKVVMSAGAFLSVGDPVQPVARAKSK